MKPKKHGFVPFQKKGSVADPDGIPGNFDANLPPRRTKGKKRPVKFGSPMARQAMSSHSASCNDGDEA